MSAVVVQDTWNGEDDQDLLEFTRDMPGFVVMTENDILRLNPLSVRVGFFATELVQRLLDGVYTAPQCYPQCFDAFYGRHIRTMRLRDAVKEPLPLFVKPCANDKSFDGTVVRRKSEFTGLCDWDVLVYVSSVVDLVNEFRLLMTPDGVHGIAESTEEVLYGRSAVGLDVVDTAFVQRIVEANALGYCIVDIAQDAAGGWLVVEVNPPFALSSYDYPIDKYFDYCAAAWTHITELRHMTDKQVMRLGWRWMPEPASSMVLRRLLTMPSRCDERAFLSLAPTSAYAHPASLVDVLKQPCERLVSLRLVEPHDAAAVVDALSEVLVCMRPAPQCCGINWKAWCRFLVESRCKDAAGAVNVVLTTMPFEMLMPSLTTVRPDRLHKLFIQSPQLWDVTLFRDLLLDPTAPSIETGSHDLSGSSHRNSYGTCLAELHQSRSRPQPSRDVSIPDTRPEERAADDESVVQKWKWMQDDMPVYLWLEDERLHSLFHPVLRDIALKYCDEDVATAYLLRHMVAHTSDDHPVPLTAPTLFMLSRYRTVEFMSDMVLPALPASEYDIKILILWSNNVSEVRDIAQRIADEPKPRRPRCRRSQLLKHTCGSAADPHGIVRELRAITGEDETTPSPGHRHMWRVIKRLVKRQRVSLRAD